MSRPHVRAAGGVLWRRHPDRGLQVVLVHRPRYDDWSFPKGKRDGDETDEECAVREVHEETGLRVKVGRELPAVEYVDGRGRDKTVRYWTMKVTGGEFVPNDEVDELRWVTVRKAADLLSYRHDRRLLEAFADSAGARV